MHYHNHILKSMNGMVVPAFVYSVTVGALETISLPMFNGDDSLYNAVVDFGDGTGDKIVTAYADIDREHEYVLAGTYDITVVGLWGYIKFTDSPTSIVELKNFNGAAIGLDSFNGGTNFATISATDIPGIYLTSLMECIRDCTSLATTTNIGNWDVSVVTDMSSMFFNAELFNGIIGTWNVGLVVDMGSMFADATIFNQILSGWNTISVTNMGLMFLRADAFNQDVSDWDVSNVATMNLMFQEADTFNNGGVALNWADTSSLVNINSMFRGASVFNQSLAGWNVSGVTNFSSLFFAATVFNQSLSTWSTVAATNMQSMFVAAEAFNQPLSTFTTTLVTTMQSMFQGALLFNQDVSSWNVGLVTTMANMFSGATAFNNGGVALNWANTGNVTTMDNMFQNATGFDQDISTFNITSLTTASQMFAGAGLSTVNYDLLLVGWEAQVEQPNVPFDAGTSVYTIATSGAARGNLVANGWIITDGGGI